jgi:hypothetical protein
MTANPAGSKLGILTLGRQHALRACLTIAVFVLVLSTLGAAAARADEPVDPAATTSAEPEATPTGSAVVVPSEASEPGPDDLSTGTSDSVATQNPPSDEPAAVPEVPTSGDPDGDDSGSDETGSGGGDGDGAATSTAEEGAGTEQAPVEEGTLAAAAEEVRDPRASIGDVDCTNRTVPVTLDNSRSTEPLVFEVFAGDFEEDEPTFEETVPVATGALQIMNVPVTEDTQFAVFVHEQPGVDYLPGRTLAFALLAVDCSPDEDPHHPEARIGGVDCDSMTVDVTLDNSRSEDETTYIVTASTSAYEEPAYERAYSVTSGDVKTIPVPVTENSTVRVGVADADAPDEFEGQLARELFRVDCTPGDGPNASIGEVDCTTLTVPVTLDNTSSAVETVFLIYASDLTGDGYVVYEEYFDVAAEAEEGVAVQVPDHAEVAVVAADEAAFFDVGETLAFETFGVDCVRVAAGRAGPHLAVGEGALAATGASGLTLPITGLTLLAFGGVLTMLARRRHG